MNTIIQTPLARLGKCAHWQRFVVSSNSLAQVMWRGFDLFCTPITTEQPQTNDLVVIQCRIAGRKYCSYRVGWLLRSDTQTLTLHYDSQRLNRQPANWTIPLAQIKRIYKVDRISVDYTRLNKFYPYAH